MNLPAEWQQALSSPVVILLLVIAAISLLLVFIIPIILRGSSGKSFKKIIKPIQSNPRPALALTAIILILAAGGYLFYYFNQPVRIVSAAQFKLEKGKAVVNLQKEGLASWRKAGLYLLDVRTRKEFAVEHLRGSVSAPAEIAAKDQYPIEKVDVIVYSAESRFDEARKVADAVKKNGDLVKGAYKEKVGTIYVVRDGFEGLKAAGLATEPGIWD